MFETKSKIRCNSPSKSSYRVTIPKNIAEILDISGNDSLDWIVSVVDNELKVCVKKSE